MSIHEDLYHFVLVLFLFYVFFFLRAAQHSKEQLHHNFLSQSPIDVIWIVSIIVQLRWNFETISFTTFRILQIYIEKKIDQSVGA